MKKKNTNPICHGKSPRLGTIGNHQIKAAVWAVLFLTKSDAFLKNYTIQVAESCQDRDLSSDSMVIGTSAIIDTEIDGAVGMNSGIFNNPFIIWGRYQKKWFRYYLMLSFQFHHTQMDGAHAGRFLANLQREIESLK